MTCLRVNSILLSIIGAIWLILASSDTEIIISWILLATGNLNTAGLMIVYELRKNNS